MIACNRIAELRSDSCARSAGRTPCTPWGNDVRSRGSGGDFPKQCTTIGAGGTLTKCLPHDPVTR